MIGECFSMDLFYLDYDTRKQCYFIAPMIQPKTEKWLIEFKTRSEADNFLKNLMLGRVMTPDKDFVSYIKLRDEEEGRVAVYKPKPL